MGFREFIRFNKQKLVLTIALFLFFPFPIYLILALMTFPAFSTMLGIAIGGIRLIMLGKVIDGLTSVLGGIVLGIILIAVIYLLSSLIYFWIKKVTKDEKKIWLIIWGIILLLVIISFFNVYVAISMDGGHGCNIIGMFKATLQGQIYC